MSSILIIPPTVTCGYFVCSNIRKQWENMRSMSSIERNRYSPDVKLAVWLKLQILPLRMRCKCYGLYRKRLIVPFYLHQPSIMKNASRHEFTFSNIYFCGKWKREKINGKCYTYRPISIRQCLNTPHIFFSWQNMCAFLFIYYMPFVINVCSILYLFFHLCRCTHNTNKPIYIYFVPT